MFCQVRRDHKVQISGHEISGWPNLFQALFAVFFYESLPNSHTTLLAFQFYYIFFCQLINRKIRYLHTQHSIQTFFILLSFFHHLFAIGRHIVTPSLRHSNIHSSSTLQPVNNELERYKYVYSIIVTGNIFPPFLSNFLT